MRPQIWREGAREEEREASSGRPRRCPAWATGALPPRPIRLDAPPRGEREAKREEVESREGGRKEAEGEGAAAAPPMVVRRRHDRRRLGRPRERPGGFFFARRRGWLVRFFYRVNLWLEDFGVRVCWRRRDLGP